MTEPEITPAPHEDSETEVGQPELPDTELPDTELPDTEVPDTEVAETEVGPFETVSEIGWPDTDPETATRARLLATSIGLTSLGRLGDLAIWLSGVQGISPPREPQRPRLIVFDGNSSESEGPAQPDGLENPALAPVVEPVVDAASVFAAVAGVGVRLVVVAGGPDSDRSAVTRAAIATGIRVADEEIDSGADLLAVGVLGSGSATAAAVLVSVMTLAEPIKVVGPSNPMGDQAWMQEVAEIRDTRLRALPHRHDVETLLSTVGGVDLAALTGFLMRAASRRTPVILDGKIVGAATLLVREISPNAVRWWQAGDRGSDPAHLLALAEFDAEPLLDLGLDVGDGVGAVLAVPLIRAAARAANDLAVPATSADRQSLASPESVAAAETSE